MKNLTEYYSTPSKSPVSLLAMFSAYTGLAALLALVVFHCEALIVPPIDGNLATTPAPLIPLPLAAAQSPANPLDDIQIQCKGPSFGTGINYASCLDAFGTFRRGTNTRPITIGQRGQRVGLSVPSRWISGMTVSSGSVQHMILNSPSPTLR